MKSFRKSILEMIEKADISEDLKGILKCMVDYIDESIEITRNDLKETKRWTRAEIREHSHLNGKVVKPY